MDTVPLTYRPLRINAAQKVARAVAELDELLDDLKPTDAESHPDSRAGEAWAQLVGAMARVELRVDAVIEAETPLKTKQGKVDGKRATFYVRDDRTRWQVTQQKAAEQAAEQLVEPVVRQEADAAGWGVLMEALLL